MKTFGSLIKATALSGIMFLLPLVLLVMFVGKAFNIVKTVSSPLANSVSASSFAGYAVVDLLALTVLLLVSLFAVLLATSPVFDNSYQKVDAIILQMVPGYSWIKGMAGIASCLKTLGRGSSKIISNTPRLRRNV